MRVEESGKVCYIAGAGDFYGFVRKPSCNDVVIAADGGLAYLEREGIEPDYVIGDFDSLSSLPTWLGDSTKCRVLPREKDVTDMYAALREGIRRGCKTFHIYGGLGGRVSHTLANIQLLADLSQKGIRAYLYGDRSVITSITDSSMKIPGSFQGYVSVFSHGERAEGVFLKRFKYPLSEAVLTNDFPLGISNECTKAEGEIFVKKGTLIIIMEEKGVDNRAE